MNRMNTFTVFILVALLLTLLTSVDAEEKYHQILIPTPSNQTITALLEIGVDLECGGRHIKGVGLEIPVTETELEMIRSRGIPFTITQEDLESYYEEICLKNLENIPPLTDDDPVHMKYGSMGGFYTFQEIVADLDSMHLLYPDLCTEKTILGYGWENNPIYMVKISDNASIPEDEPEGIFDALHHAREPGGYTAMIYAMWYLLENYGTDPEATYLVDNRELYFVPVVNPDGLLYNQQIAPSGGGSWRKNRRNNGGSYGVDLNRNYPYQWGYDNYGSSPTPSSSTYRGPEAGSEPETQAMMNFINQHNFTTGMTIHTYGGKYLCAYGYDDVPPEHYDTHFDYLAYAAAENGYSYGYCYDIMYASNGRTQDWQLHTHDIINIEPEIGDHGFWPDIQYIMPEARENLNCFLNQFWCAGGQVVFSSLEVGDGFLTPGETEDLIITIFNRGWGESESASLELATSDPYINLSTATGSTGALPPYSGWNNSADPFVASVDPDCPVGHEAVFTATINQGGFIRTADVTLIVGTPIIFFEDDAESGMGNWSVSSYWGLDNDNPHGGTYSFSDSPGREYYNNTTAIMTLANPVNLSSATTVWLDFWARWNIESNWDFCQIEVSTNGSTWIPVEGLYTVAGSGIGVQPSGEPGYEGTQGSWVHEYVDLSNYAGQSYFKFRFELRSDGGVTGDGFFADDIQLLGFTGAVPPPDVSITLTPYGAPIQIPASGGSFDFNVALTNNEATSQNFDAWIMTTLPSGASYGPVLGPVNLTLPGGGSIDRDRTQNVPAGAPTGTYDYTGYVGLYPGVIWVEDSFGFEKLGSDGSDGLTGWLNTGESFGEEGDSRIAPTTYGLSQVYPNPFNPSTAISYQLSAVSLVNLSVYDIAGRKVAELVNGWREVGFHEVVFDGSGLASGVYIVRLKAGDLSASEKMVLMK